MKAFSLLLLIHLKIFHFGALTSHCHPKRRAVKGDTDYDNEQGNNTHSYVFALKELRIGIKKPSPFSGAILVGYLKLNR